MIVEWLVRAVAILQLDPIDELAEESVLVASGIIDEFGDELLLIVPWLIVKVEIRIVDVKRIRLRLAVRILLLPRPAFSAG